jgi:hypothetical protein
MQRIQIENQFIEDGTPLIKGQPDQQLYRIEIDTFAATTALDYCLLAFRSSSLAAFLDERRIFFESFILLNAACAIGPESAGGLMLILKSNDGSQVLLNEQDEIQIACRWKPKVLTATNAWGMPPNGHLARMLLSPRLVARIEELSLEDETTSRCQMLLLIYKEYQIEIASRKKPSEPIEIDGEHFKFKAKPYNRALTFFDLI